MDEGAPPPYEFKGEAPPPSATAASNTPSLMDFLVSVKLEKFYDQFGEGGYEEVNDLLTAEEYKLADLMANLGLKPPQKLRLLTALGKGHSSQITQGTKELTNSWGAIGTYTGDMLFGKAHGRGRWRAENGDAYEGEWKDDKMNGRGKEVWGDGPCKGDVYEGEYKDDLFNGHGKYVWANNGDVYEGEWKYDKRNGRGKQVWGDGSTYEGEFKDDKQHGRGKKVWAHGTTYDGEFKNDQKHGRGKWVGATGETYEGEYKDDKANGRGKYVWANGNTYEGEFKDDKMHGRGKEVKADGYTQDGQWKDGEFLG